MTRRTGTGKYETAAASGAASLEPVPTAVAYPCEATALGRRGRGRRRDGLIVPILVGPAAKIAEVARRRPASTSARPRIVDAPDSHAAAAAKAVALVRAGRGRAADEGQPAHRRAARRGGGPGNRAAHRPPHQPRLPHGRADLPQGADRHRRRHQHRADARGQGRHLPERDRPGACRSASSGRRSRSSPRSRR